MITAWGTSLWAGSHSVLLFSVTSSSCSDSILSVGAAMDSWEEPAYALYLAPITTRLDTGGYPFLPPGISRSGFKHNSDTF